jgi:hypothetical protein
VLEKARLDVVLESAASISVGCGRTLVLFLLEIGPLPPGLELRSRSERNALAFPLATVSRDRATTLLPEVAFERAAGIA